VSRRLLAALALCSASCTGWGTSDPTLPGRDFVKDMIDSVPYDAFAKNPVFADGKTLQSPAPGSLPRGFVPFDYGPGLQEAARAAAEIKSPLAGSPEYLARGDLVFHTVCYVCHGDQGRGDGPVVPRFPTPPSLVAEHARGLAEGQIFHVIARGQGLMPSHAAQVPPADRWKVIQYVRSLQAQAAPAPTPAPKGGAR
jgi:mono/diheme cytochrome c family protein